VADSEQIFHYRHRVIYAECTVGNHIYHSRYLDILEAARGEFLRSIGHPVERLQNDGFIFPVLELTVRYQRPARYDDWLDVRVKLIQLEGVRLGVHHAVCSDAGQLLVEAETRHVCTSPDEKVRRMPRALVEALKPWLAAPVPPTSSEPPRP
jgi:acyl-CoA thioester hydrolase